MNLSTKFKATKNHSIFYYYICCFFSLHILVGPFSGLLQVTVNNLKKLKSKANIMLQIFFFKYTEIIFAMLFKNSKMVCLPNENVSVPLNMLSKNDKA